MSGAGVGGPETVVPLLTNARLASAFIDAIGKYGMDDIEIKSWDEY